MVEIFGNLWELPCDLRVITTNPDVNRAGEAVMGRGCAREAKAKVPGIERHFAKLLGAHGNRVMRLARLGDGSVLASFPVKHHWHEEADPELIQRSARQLVALADKFGYRELLIPRPGCGNGSLSW
ncbi:MAG: ADP-ribose-binding protein, partial [Actinomycetota bacterium]|nr:ADP-ribose-binding protein [Actinomycetota bacterium]